MNAQQLEFIRLELTRALLDDSGGTKGQLEAFSEHPPADNKSYPDNTSIKLSWRASVGLIPITPPYMCWKHVAGDGLCRR